MLKPTGKDVVDVGCGDGIYSKGFVLCGAKSVLGIDSSEQYIEEAGNFCPDADFQVLTILLVSIINGQKKACTQTALRLVEGDDRFRLHLKLSLSAMENKCLREQS